MNETTRSGTTTPMPRIARLEVLDDLVLRVLWSAGIRGKRTDLVDLSPLINSLRFYRPLRENPSLFRTAHLIEHGTIVAWGEHDEIDMAAESIEELAEKAMISDHKAKALTAAAALQLS